jgi:hypothetical protein
MGMDEQPHHQLARGLEGITVLARSGRPGLLQPRNSKVQFVRAPLYTHNEGYCLSYFFHFLPSTLSRAALPSEHETLFYLAGCRKHAFY